MTTPIRSTRLRAALLVGAAAFLAACSDAPTGLAPATTAAPRASAAAAVNAAVATSDAITASPSATLLACTAPVTSDSASGVVGPLGGMVGVDGSAIVIPPGAVPTTTAFTVVVPASPVVQVEIHAAGVDHYRFRRPVAVSISYARCAAAELPATSLGAWWIDSATLDQLGVMAGIDDRMHHRVTFVTDHLSGYAVVY